MADTETLPDWALLALEKRARLLENALSHNDENNILELAPGQQDIVLAELQEATQRATSIEFSNSTANQKPFVSYQKNYRPQVRFFKENLVFIIFRP